MVIDDLQRIQILLKLSEQNAKAVDWVKELDFKITYQTLFLYAAIVAFAATAAPSDAVRCVLFATVLIVALAAAIFFVRNHSRHLGLIEEDQRVRKALELTKVGAYLPEESISSAKPPDFSFYLGRALYGVVVLLGAAVAAALMWLIST